MLKDIIIILVMAVPMLLFTVYPGLKLGDYLENRYGIQEIQKRKIVIIVTILLTITLSSLLHYL